MLKYLGSLIAVTITVSQCFSFSFFQLLNFFSILVVAVGAESFALRFCSFKLF